jgi:hypothetical protein
MLYDKRMSSLKDKILERVKIDGAIAEAIGEKVKPKAKTLKGLKVGKIKIKTKK